MLYVSAFACGVLFCVCAFVCVCVRACLLHLRVFVGVLVCVYLCLRVCYFNICVCLLRMRACCVCVCVCVCVCECAQMLNLSMQASPASDLKASNATVQFDSFAELGKQISNFLNKNMKLLG